MFCQQTKPRAGAQTNLSDGENLVEGDTWSDPTSPATKSDLWITYKGLAFAKTPLQKYKGFNSKRPVKMESIKFKTKNQIILLKDKEQIGYLNFDYADDASKKRNIEISYMYVKPKYRGQGNASKMIQFLIKNKPKVTWISLWTGRKIEKVKGIDLYINNGFKKIAYQEDYYEKGIGTTLFVKKISD
jgi:ribosomal protein S18 acetylase RimI-like enzyme